MATLLIKKISTGLAVSTLLLASSVAFAIAGGQKDDFQDGTTQGWTEGSSSPNPPTNINTGGPAGANDNFLRNIATGGFGPGSRLININTSQWSGDYTAAGITEIRAQVRVVQGTGDLFIRLGFRAAGDNVQTGWVSSAGERIIANGTWQDVVFTIDEAEFTNDGAASSFAQTLANTAEFRIFHSNQAVWNGPTAVDMIMGIDNIEAIGASGSNFQGWLWDNGADNSPLPALTEEHCRGQINVNIANDDNWTADVIDEVCWGRTTTNTDPARNWFNFDGANFPVTEDSQSQSTQPLVSAGGNLLEMYGEDIEMGIGQGEERLGTVLADPADGDLLIVGGHERFVGQNSAFSFGFVDLLVSWSDDVRAARTDFDVEGRWRVSDYRRQVSDVTPDDDIIAATISTLDLQSAGFCTFAESLVFQDPNFNSNLDQFAAIQAPVSGSANLIDQSVQGGVDDVSASNCTWGINADDYVEVSFTRTDSAGATSETLQFVVSDDHNYMTWAPDPNGPNINRNSLLVAYRASFTLTAADLDGDFLFYLNLTDLVASGTGHSQMVSDLQKFEGQGRGRISFDASTPGTVPAGQTGSWFSCDMDLVIDEHETRVEGEPAIGTVLTTLDAFGEELPVTSCDFKVDFTGELLVNIVVSDPGEAGENVLFEGYANMSGDVISLLDFASEPDPVNPVGFEDLVSLRHIIGMRYTGNLLGDDDGDGNTNFEEFLIPLPPAPPLEAIVFLQDMNANGSGEIGMSVPGSTRIQIRDGSTDALISDIDFGNDEAFDIAVLPDLNANSGEEIAILNEQPSGQVRVQIRDSVSGALVRNLYYGQVYSPISMQVMQDYNASGTPEIAVMGDDPTDAIRVQVRDSGDNGFVDNVFLGTQGDGDDFVVVSDTSGNGIPELGIQSVLKGSDQVRTQVWDTATATFQTNVWFGKVYQPFKLISMPDINGNQADEIVAVGVDVLTGNIRVQVRDSDTAATIRNIWLGNTNTAVDIAVINDTNANGIPDLAILLETPGGTGRVRVQDASSGAFIRNLFYTVVEDPTSLAVMPDYSANGFEELAVSGWNNGVRHVQILDTNSGAQVNRIDFP